MQLPRGYRFRLGSWRFDLLVALALTTLVAVDLLTHVPQHGQSRGDLTGLMLAAALSLPYALHRRRPLLSLGVVVVALLAFAVRQYAGYPGYGMFALVFGIALHCPRRPSLAALAAGTTSLTVAVSLQPDGVGTAAAYIQSDLFVAVCWLGGESLRQRRGRWAALEDRALLLERGREEQARQAVAAERLRIARDLHDVVAHSMSVIAVQSGMASHVLDSQPEQARRALEAITATSRTALVEMRRLLGVLRPDGDRVGDLTPAPGLADLASLAAKAEDGGLEIGLLVDGTPVPVPAGIDLSAYRIVQEALTNVMKHGGRTAAVWLVYAPDELRIEVTDPGRGAGPGLGPAPVGAGHGLLGMRERAAVYGGQVQAGPRPGGGFRVAARLPLSVPSTGQQSAGSRPAAHEPT